MRLRVLFAAGVVMAAVTAAMLGASSSRAAAVAGCELCDGGFITLQEDIVEFVPAGERTSFLKRATLAQKFLLPPSPAFPPSPCSSEAELDSIGSSTRGLAAAGKIGQDGAATLIADVTGLTYGISSAFPPSPCLEALGGSIGDY